MEIKQSLRLPRRIADNLRILIKIAETVHNSSDLTNIYDTALDLVMELEKVDMAAIYLVEEDTNTAVLQGHRNFPPAYIEKASVIPYPKGITWKVINTGRMLNIDDMKKVREIGPAGRDAGYHGILGVPIMHGGKAIGVIWFARHEEEKFTRSEIELLTSIGNQIAIAIARAKQTSELEERNENLSVLSTIAEKVHGSADLNLIFEAFLAMIGGVKMVDLMSIYLVEQKGDSREAVLRIQRGLPDEFIEKAGRIPYPKGITWEVINTGEPVYYRNLPDEPCPLGPAGKALSPGVVLSLPLKHRGQTIGVIHFTRKEKGQFEKHELDILYSIGNQIGIAVSKAKMFEEAGRRAKELEWLYRDLKATQDQLIQSEKLASLGQLVSSIAHEINNPLTPILGYAQMLIASPDTEEEKRQKFIEVIYSSADKVRKIVENLLSFARKDKPRREYVSINDILKNTVELRQYQLELDNIGVVMDLDAGLPKTMADSTQIDQVFTNIIMNACHAISGTGAQGGTITIMTRTGMSGDIEAVITDTGPGVPEEIVHRIFDPFFTTKPTGVGTGLGLSVSYGLMKEHSGEILVESEPGKGASFIVRLPVRDYKDYLLMEEHDENGTGAEEDTPERKGRRVLVVDDEELVTMLVEGILEGEGFDADFVTNGEDALSLIRNGEYSFIICDIKMPQMNGIEFYRRVKEMNADLAGRMLFMTGDTSPETIEFVNSTGNRILAKPFKIDEFKDALTW
ncbi:MAG TPA: GAF domain-containing protein, partial [Thermodesulfobacteriota bacterium]|nr:GAF domain-containing protein [Thermodesulfobacteriota bacterium]